jgi:hypothetical protein
MNLRERIGLPARGSYVPPISTSAPSLHGQACSVHRSPLPESGFGLQPVTVTRNPAPKPRHATLTYHLTAAQHDALRYRKPKNRGR